MDFEGCVLKDYWFRVEGRVASVENAFLNNIHLPANVKRELKLSWTRIEGKHSSNEITLLESNFKQLFRALIQNRAAQQVELPVYWNNIVLARLNLQKITHVSVNAWRFEPTVDFRIQKSILGIICRNTVFVSWNFCLQNVNHLMSTTILFYFWSRVKITLSHYHTSQLHWYYKRESLWVVIFF